MRYINRNYVPSKFRVKCCSRTVRLPYQQFWLQKNMPTCWLVWQESFWFWSFQITRRGLMPYLLHRIEATHTLVIWSYTYPTKMRLYLPHQFEAKYWTIAIKASNSSLPLTLLFEYYCTYIFTQFILSALEVIFYKNGAI